MKLKKVVCSLVLIVYLICCLSAIQLGSKKVNANVEEVDEVARMESKITSLNLKGYVGTNLKNNIKYWQLHAYEDNLGIIEQIARANAEGGVNLNIVLGTDYYGVDSYYDIDVASYNLGKALSWKLKSVPQNFKDRDFVISADSSAITDWSGAKFLTFNVDATAVSSQGAIRIAFEENRVGRESYELVEGKSVYLYENGQLTQNTVLNGGFVAFPESFNGSVFLPLDEDTFQCYYNDGGNGVMDLNPVVKIMIALKGDSSAVNKCVYIDNFAIIGNFSGESFSFNGISYCKKSIWDMENLAKRDDYEYSNLQWYGEFVGKLLTGMAYCYKAEPNEELKNSAEEIISKLELAQGEDGYLGVYRGEERFSINAENWDLWNHYHIVIGLFEWYKLTANITAYSVAVNALDCILKTFNGKSYLVKGGFETNRAIAHGFAVAYQVTEEKKYLSEAERIITNDCQDENGWYKNALAGKHFYESSSNRWEILHIIMTLGILYEETGNKEYYNVMSTVWEDILASDVHNGGGFTTNEGAIGDPYVDGVIETCCTVAWMAFSNEYYKYNKSVIVVDEMERSYYNAMLGSLSDDDKYCSYNTPMDGYQGGGGYYDGRRVTSQQDISFQYIKTSPDFNCCQANLARGLGQISEWACVTDENAIYLNYYGKCEVKTVLNGKEVTIKETTDYPVNGKIDIELYGLSGEEEFTLYLRIPSWAKASNVTFDGKTFVANEGEYFKITKRWKNGDNIKLNLTTDFHYWIGINSKYHKTSVYYGPILLTADEYYSGCKTASINVKNFENAKIESGVTEGAMLFATVTDVNGEQIRLVDFASAGKYNGNSQPSAYSSWLYVVNAPYYKESVRERWINSDKYYIYSTADVFEKKGYYAGERVEIKSSDKIVEVVGIEVIEENGSMFFIMPENNLKVSVLYENEIVLPDNSKEKKSKKSNGTAIACGVAGGCFVVGTVIVSLKKVKSKKRRE